MPSSTWAGGAAERIDRHGGVTLAAPPSVVLADVVATLRAAGCVFAEDEAALLLAEAATDTHLTTMIERRSTGVPLEHVLGWAELAGVRVAVDDGVFVPRRRSELLVREAAAVAPSPAVVLDLCCGSGAVGLAVAAATRGVELHAADRDPAAVRSARRNLATVGGRVHHGDLDEPLPRHLLGRVDVLVVNAPYVPTGELDLLPVEARLHEPRVALDGGADGLELHRRVASVARRWLAPDGHLLVETSRHQEPSTTAIVAATGLATRVARCDELDATVVVGREPAVR